VRGIWGGKGEKYRRRRAKAESIFKGGDSVAGNNVGTFTYWGGGTARKRQKGQNKVSVPNKHHQAGNNSLSLNYKAERKVLRRKTFGLFGQATANENSSRWPGEACLRKDDRGLDGQLTAASENYSKRPAGIPLSSRGCSTIRK